MKRRIVGIDLFCGAGGLTFGLRRAGIDMVAGIDSDPACDYPFSTNNDSTFILADIRTVTADDLRKLYPRDAVRLLAGCAPCRPFSPMRSGVGNPRSSLRLLILLARRSDLARSNGRAFYWPF